MAGHSKWNNIKRVKAAEDSKRNKIFTKLSKDIVSAVKVGGSPDPKINTGLKSAIDRAKSFNLPSDKIDKAIKKASGVRESGEVIVTKVYEAQFEDGIEAVIIFETDNPNRSFNEVRMAVNKLEGKLLKEGSLKWKFNEFYRVKISGIEKDRVDGLYGLDGVDSIEYKEEAQEVEMLILKEFGYNIANLYTEFKDVIVDSIYISSNGILVPEDFIEVAEEILEDAVDFDSIFFNRAYESFRD